MKNNMTGMEMGGGMNMDGMKMAFHTGAKETILFTGIKTENVAEIIGACILVFILSGFYEGFKVLREMHMDHTAKKNKEEGNTVPSAFVFPHLVQTLLHIVQMTISYFLMLIFMTYNAWLCIAVALGSGAGYFAFRWRRPFKTIEDSEHCS
ncbi:high affinity copper uptake protein 1 [Octopus sinensis]|uniref:Copper transport protein n=1 Tax=Octopus sinensis TaxID=2607531 RepID=A0A6P7TCU5_9MOLL|nr:high affinity copper uptake protein 1 [Octopus sinensis]